MHVYLSARICHREPICVSVCVARIRCRWVHVVCVPCVFPSCRVDPRVDHLCVHPHSPPPRRRPAPPPRCLTAEMPRHLDTSPA
eukprot:355330-Chlamydomonas_euryale.AAC.2